MNGTLGNPRPVAAAVIAMHRARHGPPATGWLDPLVSRAVQTAHRDADGLRLLIDWPLSVAGDILRDVAELPEEDRSWVLESGLNELDCAALDAKVVADVLPRLAVMFGSGRAIRLGDHAPRRLAMGGWAVPEPPAGLTPEQTSRVAALRTRAATLDAVYLLVGEAG